MTDAAAVALVRSLMQSQAIDCARANHLHQRDRAQRLSYVRRLQWRARFMREIIQNHTLNQLFSESNYCFTYHDDGEIA